MSMTAVLRPARLFLLLTYLALSAVPFVPLLLGKSVEQPWQLLGVETIAWVAVWAVCKRPAWFHWLLLPAFLALPTELYLYIYYGQGVSTHHLGIIAETSPKEAMEFLGNTVWLMAAVTAAVIAWWIATWRIALAERALDWHDASRWVTLAGLAAGAGVLAYGLEFGVAAKSASTKASAPASDQAVSAAHYTGASLPPLPHAARLPVELDAVARSWPFGLVWRGVDFYKERQHLAAL